MDRKSKLLLAAIALGLWANAIIPILKPPSAAAQNANVESYLRGIESSMGSIASTLGSIQSNTGTIQGSVFTMENGTCRNKKVC